MCNRLLKVCKVKIEEIFKAGLIYEFGDGISELRDQPGKIKIKPNNLSSFSFNFK